MKKVILFIALLTIWLGQAQILEPVKWSTSVEKVSDTEYKLISKATIESGWHLYSQNVPEDGPIPTSFIYDDFNGAFKFIDNTSEEEGHTVDDPVFQMKIKFFEKSAIFVQKMEVLGEETTVNGIVEFMVCDDSRCLPPTEVELVFNLSESKNAITTSTDEQNIKTDTIESLSTQKQ